MRARSLQCLRLRCSQGRRAGSKGRSEYVLLSEFPGFVSIASRQRRLRSEVANYSWNLKDQVLDGKPAVNRLRARGHGRKASLVHKR